MFPRRSALALAMALVVAGCSVDPTVEPPPVDSTVEPPPVSPPTRALFVPIAEFPGLYRDVLQPWSPVGTKLAYAANWFRHDLMVFDASRPADPPVLVYSGSYIEKAAWSPDGAWLACHDVTSNFPPPSFQSSIVAVRADGTGQPIVLRTGIAGGHVIWAANGQIYYWEGGVRQELDPPPAWRAENPGPFPDHPELLWFPSGKRLHLFVFRVTPEVALVPIPGLNGMPAGYTVSPREASPDGRRFLALVTHVESPDGRVTRYSVAAEELGNVVTRYWDADESHFTAWSASADNRYVFGCNDLMGAAPYIADAGAAWLRQIEGAPPGKAPKASRTDSFVAYMAATRDAIYVGRVELQDAP